MSQTTFPTLNVHTVNVHTRINARNGLIYNKRKCIKAKSVVTGLISKRVYSH